MDGRKAKFSEFVFTELFLDDAVEGLKSHSGSKRKALPNKTLDKLNLFKACWQNRKSITASEVRFQRPKGPDALGKFLFILRKNLSSIP